MSKVFLNLRVYCVIGLLLSIYATYVELKAEKDSDYVALCDLGASVSCTAAFTSFYGRGFGITQNLLGPHSKWNPPNGFMGILFYIFLMTSTYYKRRWVTRMQIVLCLLSNLLSIYLAYLLYFVLEFLCIICVSIYAVNYFCLKESWNIYKQLWSKKNE